jgi:hypothetical protein
MTIEGTSSWSAGLSSHMGFVWFNRVTAGHAGA